MRFWVFWLKIAFDIYEYIQDCLSYAKWAITPQSVPFILIQTGKLYELIEIHIFDPFEKSAYRSTHIYNLVDYFFSNIYPHLTPSVDADNVILSFDYYLHFNLKSYIVYIDVDTCFLNQKLCTYLWKKDIALIFTFFTFYKLVDLIKKSNNILL